MYLPKCKVIFVVLHSCSCFITDLQNNNHASIDLCIQESNAIILNINNNANDWWWFQQFAEGIVFCRLTKGVTVWVNCSVCCLLSSFPGVSWLCQEHGSLLQLWSPHFSCWWGYAADLRFLLLIVYCFVDMEPYSSRAFPRDPRYIFWPFLEHYFDTSLIIIY